MIRGTSIVEFGILASVVMGGLSARAGGIDFSRQIRPILSENCFACHGPDEKKREAELRLDDEASAKRVHEGVTAVVPGAPDRSALIQRIETTDPEEVMPPPKMHKTVSAAQLGLLKQWITEGAKWGKHWSYERVTRPAVPAAVAGGNAMDAFLERRLREEGLAFSPEAEPFTLIRRVALDLTGLPPTLEELERFQPAHGPLSADAYGAMVDYFLQKTAFGEHWARMWLDLARYADSSGYPSDQPREIWGYRDWVVRAFNNSMPFDQFTVEQLAGDLLPKPTDDQLIATAFHRNTMTQNEGGTSDEEFRVAAVIDRVNTTMAVWMGTTMACAQCHSHKYDPISQKEYFQFYAFFNQSADADRKDETPVQELMTPELKRQRTALETELAQIESRFAQPPAAWLSGFDAWLARWSQAPSWQALHPAVVKASSGTEARVDAAGEVTLNGRADKDVITVEVPLAVKQLTALELETRPQPGFGNFVVTGIGAEVISTTPRPSPQARYVRVELPGKKKFLQLAEVQVFNGGENVATKGSATQSSQYTDAAAARAIDGRTEGDYAKGSVAHTSGNDDSPWWEVDLKTAQAISRVVIWNRTDGKVGGRLDGFRIIALDERRQPVWESGPQARAPAVSQEFSLGDDGRITFASAQADFEQSGFTAASVLKPGEKDSKGWAVAGATEAPHRLTLTIARPIPVPAGAKLRVTIRQQSEFPQHVLGRFALRASDDARMVQSLALPAKVREALAVAAPNRKPAQTQAIAAHYVRVVAPEAAAERKQLASLQKQLAALKPTTVPIMRDLAGKDRRVTNIQIRGNWQALGDEVHEGVPAAFNRWPNGAPMNRLSLARWLVSRDNPLTARVAVNRFWEALFGIGIVRSSEEFGSQGDAPIHPELLDWLAAEFMESGWDVKHLLKVMVSSRAYRQTSRSSPELNERDPDNRLLARGPRFRPTGELLRDQALAVSGLLSAKMGGPGVRPAAPNLGLSTAFGRSNDWTTSEGEDRHRRSLYTEVRRNSPYPSFSTFDAPNREVCTLRRGRTNTPLQAFVTLNDPVFVEASQAMARRLMSEGGTSVPERLTRLFRLCLSRPPAAAETDALTRLHDESLATYRADTALAQKMATEPLGPAPAGAAITELAAWTAIANIVMNLDEYLMRR